MKWVNLAQLLRELQRRGINPGAVFVLFDPQKLFGGRENDRQSPEEFEDDVVDDEDQD